MAGSSDGDIAVQSNAQIELDQLLSRINQQSLQLNTHARELSRLRQDVESLNERLDAHQHHGEAADPSTSPG